MLGDFHPGYFNISLLPILVLEVGFRICYKGTNHNKKEDVMSEFSNEPMVPESQPEMSLVDTWVAAVTKPNESTFARIVAQPGATAGKAFLWVFLASILTSLASLIAQAVSFGGQSMMRQFLPPEIARDLPFNAAPSIGFGGVICGAPVGAVIAVIVFAIVTALIQWVAKLFGGTGSFDKLAYAFSAITVPYSVVSAVLALIGIIPIINILTGLISFGLTIYVIVLEVLAVKAVNGLDTGKAVGSVLLPGLAIFLLICCCFAAVIGGLAMMGPAIGDVFDSINQSLGGF
jgi:hypothetical protein